MNTPKKIAPVSEVQARLRELIANWPEEDTNIVAVQATGIERCIPPDSTNENAIKALEFCKQARRFGATEKGFLFLKEAESARKDFELSGDAIKGAKHGASQADRRKGKTKLSESNKEQILREYEAAVSTYGTIKSLARKFDVSEDTISRIVNVKHIPKRTIKD